MSTTALAPISRVSAWLGGNMPVARMGLILNLFIPIIFLIGDALQGKLGADPVNNALHTTGLVALTFLLLSLAVTPARMATGWTWLVQFRRSLGVYAFYYACAHLAIYFWWDRGHSLHRTVYEITHRFYLMIGFISLVLMAPLWATSFNAAIQVMGATWWKRLHRLAYVAAGLGCWHLYLQTKADKRRPDVYFAVLAVLLLWRVGAVVLRRRRALTKTVSASKSAKAKFWKGELKVIEMFRETETVRTFRFALAEGGPIPFVFKAGQFLNLSLKINGQSVSRSYTIASPPTRDGFIELTVKRETNGHVSGFLHDRLMAGHDVTISAPSGRFTFDSDSNKALLLIAGGVGITPVMSILRDLTDRDWPGRIDLVFSVRTPAEIIFREELKALADQRPNLRVHITITRDSETNWSGLRGRITRDLLRQCVPDVVRRTAFICGPDAMAVAARDELLALGLPDNQIKLESFTPTATVTKDDGARSNFDLSQAATTTVTFSQSGRSAPMRADQTVLEAAEAVGVSIDYQCRSGICGTCRCKLISGQVTMLNRDALSDTDEAEGYILACQARAIDQITVDA